MEGEKHGFLELECLTTGRVQAGHYEQGRNWRELDYGMYGNKLRKGRYGAQASF
jgi:hypothetical protein